MCCSASRLSCLNTSNLILFSVLLLLRDLNDGAEIMGFIYDCAELFQAVLECRLQVFGCTAMHDMLEACVPMLQDLLSFSPKPDVDLCAWLGCKIFTSETV